MKTVELSPGEYFEIEIAGAVVRLMFTQLTKRRHPMIAVELPAGGKIRRMKESANPPSPDWEFP